MKKYKIIKSILLALITGMTAAAAKSVCKSETENKRARRIQKLADNIKSVLESPETTDFDIFRCTMEEYYGVYVLKTDGYEEIYYIAVKDTGETEFAVSSSEMAEVTKGERFNLMKLEMKFKNNSRLYNC